MDSAVVFRDGNACTAKLAVHVETAVELSVQEIGIANRFPLCTMHRRRIAVAVAYLGTHAIMVRHVQNHLATNAIAAKAKLHSGLHIQRLQLEPQCQPAWQRHPEIDLLNLPLIISERLLRTIAARKRFAR